MRATALGIDLSTDPAKTAACLTAWEDGRGRIERLLPADEPERRLDDDRLAELAAEADLAGIDAPFGWPREFVEAVSGWQESARWPSVEDPRSLRLRATDLRITKPRPPLSVSTDLIGVTAMRCARLLTRLAEDHEVEVDRSGRGGGVIEVYPAAALHGWGFDVRGYKGRTPDARERRAHLTAKLGDALANCCPVGERHRRLFEDGDHALDAFVASLVVRARMIGETRLPETPEEDERAAIEGWIHLPTVELSALS